jgi:hypothetical protein
VLFSSTTTRPATEPLFRASIRISFSTGLRNSLSFALVGWSQLVFSATFRPLMKTVAPLSQVKSILADLTAPVTLKVLRKVAFSPSLASLAGPDPLRLGVKRDGEQDDAGEKQGKLHQRG